MTTPHIRGTASGPVSRGLLLGAAAISAAALVAAILHRPEHIRPDAAILYFGMPAIVCAAALIALRLPASARLAIVANGLAVALACYGLEIVAVAATPRWYSSMAMRSLPRLVPVGFLDRRTPLAVVAAYRRTGKEPVFPYSSRTTADEVFERAGGSHLGNPRPLAGVANVLTVLCSERGPYQSYHSDRYGFNNPDSLWNAPAGVALLGDSFVQGVCVDDRSTITADLRADGIRALSLGISGNGPLSELATLREYGAAARPAVIAWAYFEGNDLCDLDEELGTPVLSRYLDTAFSQHLIARQPQIDRMLSDDFDAQIEQLDHTYGQRDWALRDLITLGPLRRAVNIAPLTDPDGRRRKCADVPDLRRILSEAVRESGQMGASFVFVYLPTRRPLPNPREPGPVASHDSVLDVVRSLHVPIVDLDATLTAPAVRDLDWVSPVSHYSVAGYAAVARAVEAQLRPRTASALPRKHSRTSRVS